MATDSGYPDQKKSSDRAQHVTVGPIREQQHGYDVKAHMYVQSVATDAAETGSTTTSIVATSHVALVGDVISFTSGALAKKEYAVESVSTNAIVTVEAMSVAPSNGDTFKILRFKHPVVDSDGLISVSSTPGPTQFVLDGVDTEVEEDTGTPANNKPLPVKLVNASGDIIGQENMAASIPVVIASDQSALTVSLPTGASTEAKQDSEIALLTTIDGDTGSIAADASTIAGDTTSIDGKIPAQGQAAMAASLPVVIASDQSSIDVDVTNLPATVDTNSGAAGASTLRTVLATRHEAAATPVASRLSDGTDFISAEALAAAQKTVSTLTKMLTTLGIMVAWDGTDHRELSCDTSGNLNVNAAATSNIAYQAKGKIVGSSLTGTYADLLNPSSDLRVIYLINSCNNTILVSLDGGSTDTFELEAGESLSIDLAASGLKFDNAVTIQAKHGGAAPTAGSIRCTGIG